MEKNLNQNNIDAWQYLEPCYIETDSDAEVSIEMEYGEDHGKVTGRWIAMKVTEDGGTIWAYFSPEQARELAHILTEAADTIERDEKADLTEKKIG